MRIEFHVHTDASHDSLLGRKALIRALVKKGIDAVAICDHNEVSFALENKDAFARLGIELIVGEEIFTSEGEIIGLFLTKRIAPGMSPEETIAEIHRQKGLVCVPHPYDEKRYRTVLKPEALNRIASLVDLMEVHNGRNIDPSYSDRQREIADSYGLRHIVGSDAHTAMEIGRNYCESEASLSEPLTPEGLLQWLESASFITAPCLTAAHKKTRRDRVRKMLRKGDFRGIYRAFKRKLNKRRS